MKGIKFGVRSPVFGVNDFWQVVFYIHKKGVVISHRDVWGSNGTVFVKAFGQFRTHLFNRRGITTSLGDNTFMQAATTCALYSSLWYLLINLCCLQTREVPYRLRTKRSRSRNQAFLKLNLITFSPSLNQVGKKSRREGGDIPFRIYSKI